MTGDAEGQLLTAERAGFRVGSRAFLGFNNKTRLTCRIRREGVAEETDEP